MDDARLATMESQLLLDFRTAVERVGRMRRKKLGPSEILSGTRMAKRALERLAEQLAKIDEMKAPPEAVDTLEVANATAAIA